MEIKKHKIKILSDKQNSSFVVDLRLEKPKTVPEPRVAEKKTWTTENFVLPKIKEQKKREKKSFNFKFKIPKIKFKLKNPFAGIKIRFRFGKKRNFWNSGRLTYPKKGRALIYFVLLLLVLIIPFKIYSYYRLATDERIKNSLLNYSVSGVEGFISASNNFSNLDLAQAQRSFLQAGKNFLSLDQELQKMDEFVILLASLSNKKELRLASQSKNVAKVGVYLSAAGNDLSLAVNALIESFSAEKKTTDFSEFYTYSKKSLNNFKKANKYLNKIDASSVPEEYREQFIELQAKAKVLEKNMDDFVEMIPALEDFLGIKTDKKYLVVFQNNAELRASGGFIGSYALIDLKKGRIKNIEVPAGGSYDTEGGMRVLVESPKPLHLVKSNWYFWDANWWPDWKMSAQNLMWFLEKSSGPSVDGVISLTPDVLRDILEITGPIDLTEKYGVVVDSNNFWELIQEIVEVVGQPEVYQDKNLKTDILSRVDISTSTATSSLELATSTATTTLLRNEPKKIIGDLMSKIMGVYSSSFNKEMLFKTLKVLEDNLSKKNILLYFSNKKLQAEVENRSWAGRIKEAPLDYLMIVDTNIAGGKTSYFVKNDFSLAVDIQSDGSIVNKLRIDKKHLGQKGDLFSGIRNVNWLRVYVPLGSTLISAQGFSQPEEQYFKEVEASAEKNEIVQSTEENYELDPLSQTKIYQESGKTVFANWTMIDPSQSEVIEIEYKLPYNFYTLFEESEKTWWDKLFPEEKQVKYSLLWQKQAGAQASSMDFSFSSDLIWSPIWVYPSEAKMSQGQVDFSETLDGDKYTAIIFE